MDKKLKKFIDKQIEIADRSGERLKENFVTDDEVKITISKLESLEPAQHTVISFGRSVGKAVWIENISKKN